MVIGQMWCIPFMLWHSSHTIMMCYQALWNGDRSNVVYPCHAVVVAMRISNGHQRFFIGHTDKVRNADCSVDYIVLCT